MAMKKQIAIHHPQNVTYLSLAYYICTSPRFYQLHFIFLSYLTIPFSI